MSVALIAVALFCWPPALPVGAAPAVQPVDHDRGRRRTSVGALVWLPGLLTAAAVLATGLMVGLAVGVVAFTAGGLVRSELARRRSARCVVDLLAATRTLAREVRSGAAPLAAVAAGATAHAGAARRFLQQLSVAVAGDRTRDGTVVHPRPDAAGDGALIGEVVDRLVQGHALSARYGVPWAALVETVADDLAGRVNAAALREAQVAGPRVSGYVLAVLPVLGIVLGLGMGADPLRVLFRTGAGQLLLLIGCVLSSAGLVWTARIVRG